MIELTIAVEGMMCGMCESHVNDAVRRVNGVKKVSSSHSKARTVVIAEDSVDSEKLAEAIKAQGYGVENIECKPYVKRGIFGIRK